MSGTSPAGGPSASSASRPATSSASTGCTRTPDGSGTTGSRLICRATMRISSWNWVARRVVHGSPDSATTRSAASFDAK